MEKSTTLLFITAEYPFGHGETFIDAELKVLSDHFNEIIIIPTEISCHSVLEKRRIPSNCTILVREYEKKSKFVFHLFRLRFLQMLFSELVYVRKKLHLKFQWTHLKIAIKSYLSALIIRNSIVSASKNLNSEIVLLYSYWMGDGMLAALLSRSYINKQIGTKVFSRAHGWDLYFERHNPAYLPWRKFMIDECNAIFCISKNGQLYLREKFPTSQSSKILLEYLGVPAPSENFRMPDFNLPGLRIVSCSNVVPVKRVMMILLAVEKLTVENVFWTHIGDGPLLSDLKKEADCFMKISPNFKIAFTGQLLPEMRDQLLGSGNFHLFVNVSESEGLPVSIMEAMSFGIPVLATDVGGTSEIVENGANGLLISKNVTPQDLAEHLEYFNKMHHDLKQKLSVNARQTWLRNFQSETNHIEFTNKVQELF